jgi:hypothetical protein
MCFAKLLFNISRVEPPPPTSPMTESSNCRAWAAYAQGLEVGPLNVEHRPAAFYLQTSLMTYLDITP